MLDEITSILGEWKGYFISGATRIEPEVEGAPAIIEVSLSPNLDRSFVCDGCGCPTTTIHEVVPRRVRDLPVFDAITWLLVDRVRVDCKTCGHRVERIDWLPTYSRMTARLVDSIGRLCRVLPVKHVAEHFCLGWDAVKHADYCYLERTVGPPDLSRVEQIVMDEFAIQKGHRYATVIADPCTKEVLWVCRGRGRADVRPFFEALGKDGRARLKAAAIDMNAEYELEIRAQCPNAEVVFDLFHVVAKFGREVIDRVRVDEANRLRHDKSARRVVKGSRWLLLRNAENVTRPQDKVRLKELLKANKKLMTVYVLKDDLKHLWDFKYPKAAERFWKQWYSRAIRSRIEPLKRFARKLKDYLPGIISHCRFPLHTSLIEGINNKIKVIKRMAYGFRDDKYFFLKIRAAFPGNPG